MVRVRILTQNKSGSWGTRPLVAYLYWSRNDAMQFLSLPHFLLEWVHTSKNPEWIWSLHLVKATKGRQGLIAVSSATTSTLVADANGALYLDHICKVGLRRRQRRGCSSWQMVWLSTNCRETKTTLIAIGRLRNFFSLWWQKYPKEQTM